MQNSINTVMRNKGVRLNEEEALRNIKDKCNERGVEFIGFDNETNSYINNKTYLILRCNKCNKIWKTTTYDKFVRYNRSCPNCSRTKKVTLDELISNTLELCEEKEFTFLGISGPFKGVRTKLKLKCNRCGYEWHTTTYVNLIKKDRKSHSCNKRNPLYSTVGLRSDKATKRVLDSLKETSLEFVSFKDGEYIGFNKTKVILKCKKCNKLNEYSFSYICSHNISCKYCEYNGKISNEAAIKIIEDKCKDLNYTFLGFKTIDGRYDGKDTYLILKCNKCGRITDSTKFYVFVNRGIKCLNCSRTWKMEDEIKTFLDKEKIDYIYDCRSRVLPWLKNRISLSLDFYLPKYNTAIECQGIQHFEPSSFYGGEKEFVKTCDRDKRKLLLCKENNVTLLYYDSETQHQSFLGEVVFKDVNNLFKEILKNG